jgi:hypothetical protein
MVAYLEPNQKYFNMNDIENDDAEVSDGKKQ